MDQLPLQLQTELKKAITRYVKDVRKRQKFFDSIERPIVSFLREVIPNSKASSADTRKKVKPPNKTKK